jgi:TfoX/Sxy family transcriptional regulator of competence genes
MAVNPALTKRVREALSNQERVEEKKMFRGIAFMVNEKMCVTVADDRIMCRIDPSIHDASIRQPGVSTVKMRGRDYMGWVLVKESNIPNKKELMYWMKLALEYNRKIRE